MNRSLIRIKLITYLLVLAMLFSFAGGMGLTPRLVEAQEEEVVGDFLLNVGNYRGLEQEPSIPVRVRDAEELVALEFIVVSSNNFNIDVAVKSVERGADLPGGATITWSGVGHGDVKIGIFMHEAGFTGSGELVRINFKHDATEQTYNQPIALNVDPLDVTVRVVEGELEEGQIFGDDSVELPITSSSISNGEIRVAIMFGDMDKNENVTVNDALLALRASVGDLELTPQLIDAGDVKRAPDANAVDVTVYDALLIAKMAVGLIDFFPVYPDPDADPDPTEQTMFTIQPSAIYIGDYELTNPRTVIGGEVTFTVRFPTRIIGDVKLEVSGAQVTDTNTEFINGNEVDITVDLTDHTGGLGERVVSAFQYNTITREEGVRLDRFVKVVEEDGPRQLFVEATRNRQLDFSWNPTNAASKITIRQSIDGSAWVDARTLSSIESTDTSATVAGLDPERGYYFKLKVNGGVHHGQSDVIRFNRMTTDTIAERIGGDLQVTVLYTGTIENLDHNRNDDFQMVDANGNVIATANSISMHQSRAIRAIFQGSSEEDFFLRYSGATAADNKRLAETLDRDVLSFVLCPDEAPVGRYGVVSEVSVTTAQELSGALANTSVNRIALGSNITLTPATLNQPAQEIDGDGFTLTGNLVVDADNAVVSNLTIDGNLIVNGNNFAGNNLTVEGSTTITGNFASFNTTFEGPVTVEGENTTFTNVTFEDRLTIDPMATGTQLQDCTLMGNVTVNENVNFTDIDIADDLTITIDDGKTLTLNGSLDVDNNTLTFDGDGELGGNARISGTTGKVAFGSSGNGVDVEDLAFGVDVDVNEIVNFTNVELADDLTVTVASGIFLTFDGDLEMAARRVFTFAGAGTVVFDVADMNLEDAVFTIAEVNILADATLRNASIDSSVTVDVFGGNTLTLAGDTTVASGRTLTLDGTGNVEGDNGTITGAGRLIVSSNMDTISDLDVELDTTILSTIIAASSLIIKDVTFTRAVAVNDDVTFDGVRINGTLSFDDTQRTVSVSNTLRTAAVNTTGDNHVFNLVGDSVWTLTGGVDTADVVTLQGSGTITGAQTFNANGTVNIGTGSDLTIENVTFAGPVSFDSSTGSNVALSGITLNHNAATEIGANTLTVGSGGLMLGHQNQVLTLDNSSSTIDGTGTINGTGSIATSAASAEIDGVTLDVDLDVGHALAFTGGGWTAGSTVEVTAGVVLTLAGTIQNAGTLHLSDSGASVAGTYTLANDIVDNIVFANLTNDTSNLDFVLSFNLNNIILDSGFSIAIDDLGYVEISATEVDYTVTGVADKRIASSPTTGNADDDSTNAALTIEDDGGAADYTSGTITVTNTNNGIVAAGDSGVTPPQTVTAKISVAGMEYEFTYDIVD